MSVSCGRTSPGDLGTSDRTPNAPCFGSPRPSQACFARPGPGCSAASHTISSLLSWSGLENQTSVSQQTKPNQTKSNQSVTTGTTLGPEYTGASRRCQCSQCGDWRGAPSQQPARLKRHRGSIFGQWLPLAPTLGHQGPARPVGAPVPSLQQNG